VPGPGTSPIGKFRLPLILRAASAFRLCGDWSQGIDRIRCPDCGYDLLRPFSCKKVLRVFLRHDRDLFADIGRLPFDILSRFFTQAAGRSIRTAMVWSHQTFGEFGVWHPHWHAIVLEGGFDRHDRFFFIPLGASEALTEVWRHRVVALFLHKGLLNPNFARKLLSWRHSGFSIESGTRIYDQDSRRALCQYIVRAPLSLQKSHWDEEQDAVSWKSSPSGYFKGRQRHFSALDFIAQVTLHIPPRGRHLVRRYGLYSSRGRGTWKDRPARSGGKRALPQESLGAAARQGLRTGRDGLPQPWKQDVGDRPHSRSCRDPKDHRLPIQARSRAAHGRMIALDDPFPCRATELGGAAPSGTIMLTGRRLQ
jgi:hypothetical protein